MSLYQGKAKFDREQLIFSCQVILIGALDRLILPDGDATFEGRERLKTFTDYELGALESAGMALAVFYAQLTDDGLGIYDALGCAGDFDEACQKFIAHAWKNGGRPIKKLVRQMKPGDCYDDLYGGFKPDSRKHAEAFVTACFTEYLLKRGQSACMKCHYVGVHADFHRIDAHPRCPECNEMEIIRAEADKVNDDPISRRAKAIVDEAIAEHRAKNK